MKVFLSLVLALVLAVAIFSEANAAGAVSSGPGINIVPPGFKWPQVARRSTPTIVTGVVTHDTHIDISAAINADATAAGVSPIGLTAVLATESGINQYADRYGVWPDVSFGIAQFTVQTATGRGLCSDTASCRAVLDNPFTSIRAAAQYLGEIARQTCLIFPTLYVAYNAGPNYGCNAGFYYNPSGTAALAYRVFVNNYAYVGVVYGTSPPVLPPPEPVFRAPIFHLALFDAWCIGHHKPCPSPYFRHKLSWAASIWRYHQPECRGIVDARYHASPHAGGAGYTDTRFALCTVVTWARFHRVRIKYRQLIR